MLFMTGRIGAYGLCILIFAFHFGACRFIWIIYIFFWIYCFYIGLRRFVWSRKQEIMSRGNPLRWPRDALYPQKLTLTSPTSGGRSVDIVRLWAKSHGVF
jgi:hypothetical protein